MTLLFTDELFLKHDTGKSHPERAERLRSITARLDRVGLIKRCTAGTYKPVSEDALRQVHDARMVHVAKQLAEHGGHLDGDTPICPESFRIACAAAGVAVAAVDAVLAGKETNALCLVRPPGHHATPTRSMGFCLFNNVALAAQHARTAHKLTKILIVDWDVHHGNGTQDVFYENGEVMFFSIHRYGRGFYPGSGDVTETGTGKGLGYVLNTPIRYGTERKDFKAAFVRDLEKAADKIKPELVLLSAGFDAHARDPIGSLGLEVEDFTEMTRAVLAVAKSHARGRLVSCLEGGYHLDALAESVQTHLEELLAFKP